MTIDELMNNIESFRNDNTQQSWIMSELDISFKNEFIEVLRIDSSNKSGGNTVKKGKMWSIIIKIIRDFTKLYNWKLLEKRGIQITSVNRGKHEGNYGIRVYNMSIDPNNKIIYDILNFIFEKEE